MQSERILASRENASMTRKTAQQQQPDADIQNEAVKRRPGCTSVKMMNVFHARYRDVGRLDITRDVPVRRVSSSAGRTELFTTRVLCRVFILSSILD